VKLEIKNLKFGYGSVQVLKNISMDALPGSITAILGPNAVGKSTLLKCIAGILKPKGIILLDGQEISSFNQEKITKLFSYLSQESFSRVVLSVFEVVLLGRIHSLSWNVCDEELKIVWDVLSDMGMRDLATRYINELSGGQKQMVSIAQALVREPRVLLLDEPTNNLDLQHQLETLGLIRELTDSKMVTTIVSLHDLALAARYADNLVVLKDGVVYSSGKPESVLTPEMMKDVYGVNALIALGDDGILQVTPLSSIRNKRSA
jgi:iron complex transport system ATP-binding protein